MSIIFAHVITGFCHYFLNPARYCVFMSCLKWFSMCNEECCCFMGNIVVLLIKIMFDSLYRTSILIFFMYIKLYWLVNVYGLECFNNFDGMKHLCSSIIIFLMSNDDGIYSLDMFINMRQVLAILWTSEMLLHFDQLFSSNLQSGDKLCINHK